MEEERDEFQPTAAALVSAGGGSAKLNRTETPVGIDPWHL
jgi:hypothetical protein